MGDEDPKKSGRKKMKRRVAEEDKRKKKWRKMLRWLTSALCSNMVKGCVSDGEVFLMAVVGEGCSYWTVVFRAVT